MFVSQQRHKSNIVKGNRIFMEKNISMSHSYKMVHDAKAKIKQSQTKYSICAFSCDPKRRILT